MKEIAIIGPTASGKSALAIESAIRHNAHILSLDSLSLYKEIDIISAKPSEEELARVHHFGIDLIYPDEEFSARNFISLYETTRSQCKKEGKNLIIVGGSSFYLKSLLDGLSKEPDFSEETRAKVKSLLTDINEAYRVLQEVDPASAGTIAENDRYRIEKGLLTFFETGLPLCVYRKQHEKEATASSIAVFEIEIERELLRERIAERTELMLQQGAIDEAAALERRYTRAPKSMGSIGIKEILAYFDGKISRIELPKLISTHTAQFAKRQNTFNRHQFDAVTRLPLEELPEAIDTYFSGAD